jgi:hypothetical protein
VPGPFDAGVSTTPLVVGVVIESWWDSTEVSFTLCVFDETVSVRGGSVVTTGTRVRVCGGGVVVACGWVILHILVG